MGEESLAAVVDFLQEHSVLVIRPPVAETNNGQWRRRNALEFWIGVHPRREFLRPCDVCAQQSLDAFPAEVAHYEPKLQRAKAPAQRNTVVHQVYGPGVFLRLGFQVFRNERECTLENVRTAGIE